MKLVQITDLHISRSGELIDGGDTAERFRQLVGHVNAEHGDADLVIATGDLTNWGDPESYERLRLMLEPLIPPVALLIGNHDIRAAFQAAFPAVPKDADGNVQYVCEVDGHRLIMMDTVRPGTHAGQYDAPRLHWLDQELSRSEQPCLLFMHHPPMPIGLPAEDRIGQRDHRQLAEVLKRHRHRIRYIAFGHCHMAISASYLGIPVIGIRSSCHRQGWPDFRERHTLNACDLPACYAVILVSDDLVLQHTIDFAYEGPIDGGICPDFKAWQREAVAA